MVDGERRGKRIVVGWLAVDFLEGLRRASLYVSQCVYDSEIEKVSFALIFQKKSQLLVTTNKEGVKPKKAIENCRRLL